MKKSLYSLLLCILVCLPADNLSAMGKFDVKKIATGLDHIYSVQFCRSGNRLLTENRYLWNADTGEYLHDVGWVKCDKRREVLFRLLGGYVKVYDFENGKLMWRLKQNADACCADVNRKKTMIATGGDDGKALLWDANSAGPICTLAEHTAAVKIAIFFKNNPWMLLTASKDTTCKIWDVRQSTSVKTVAISAPIISVKLNKSENVIVCSYKYEEPNDYGKLEEAVRVSCVNWPTDQSKIVDTTKLLGEGHVVLNRSSNKVVVASGRDETSLVDLTDLSHFPLWLKHGARIFNVGMNKKYVVTAGYDTVKIWNPLNLKHYGTEVKCSKTLGCAPKLIGTIACDHQGLYVLAGLDDGVVKVWNINKGKKLKTFKASSDVPRLDQYGIPIDRIIASEFSKSGTRFATGSDDGTLAIGTSV